MIDEVERDASVRARSDTSTRVRFDVGCLAGEGKGRGGIELAGVRCHALRCRAKLTVGCLRLRCVMVEFSNIHVFAEFRALASRVVASDIDLLDGILGVVTQPLEDALPDLAVDVVVEKHDLVSCVTSSGQHTKRQAPNDCGTDGRRTRSSETRR